MATRQSNRTHSSVANLDIANGKLTEILSLTEAEGSALEQLIADFRRQLHTLERSAAIETPESQGADVADQRLLVLKIPTKIAGKGELFDELEVAIAELLGDGRGHVAYTWLSSNPAFGRRDGSKEYDFERRADGTVEVTTRLQTFNEYLPGTTVHYGGEPGVEPDVVPGWGSKSTGTLDTATAEAIFGNLIDISSLPIVETN